VPAKVTKVACQSCGANLSIDESIRFVTCGYCSASLEIIHSSSASYSKTLEEVIKRQDAVEAELKVLRLEKQIQRLEDEWESFRARVSSKTENGTLVEPGKFGPILFGVITGAFAIFVGVFAASEGSWILGLLAIGVMILAYFIPQHGIRRAKEFALMRNRYLQKKTQLKSQLSSAERALRFAPMKRSGKPGKFS
jgi:hypothetical protein